MVDCSCSAVRQGVASIDSVHSATTCYCLMDDTCLLIETSVDWQFVVSGDCAVCQFFERSLTDEEKCEVPSELSGSSRCTCIAQVNECKSDNAGITALHVACSRAGLSLVQFLLERGAAVNVVTVNQSYTPLQVSQFTWCVGPCFIVFLTLDLSPSCDLHVASSLLYPFSFMCVHGFSICPDCILSSDMCSSSVILFYEEFIACLS